MRRKAEGLDVFDSDDNATPSLYYLLKEVRFVSSVDLEVYVVHDS